MPRLGRPVISKNNLHVLLSGLLANAQSSSKRVFVFGIKSFGITDTKQVKLGLHTTLSLKHISPSSGVPAYLTAHVLKVLSCLGKKAKQTTV